MATHSTGRTIRQRPRAGSCMLTGIAIFGMVVGSTGEQFIIPNGYLGDVYILYDVTECAPGNGSRWSMTYRIPQSGILCTAQKCLGAGPGPTTITSYRLEGFNVFATFDPARSPYPREPDERQRFRRLLPSYGKLDQCYGLQSCVQAVLYGHKSISVQET
jgi:hypothetical protein